MAEVQGAHAAGVTQKQLDALAAAFLPAGRRKGRRADLEAQKAAVEAEFARLGPNGKQVARDVGQWLKGLAGRGLLTEAELGAIRGVTTADGVRALAKLRELSGDKAIPTTALEDGMMAQADANRLMQEGYRDNDQDKIRRGRQALEALDKAGKLIAPR